MQGKGFAALVALGVVGLAGVSEQKPSTPEEAAQAEMRKADARVQGAARKAYVAEVAAEAEAKDIATLPATFKLYPVARKNAAGCASEAILRDTALRLRAGDAGGAMQNFGAGCMVIPEDTAGKPMTVGSDADIPQIIEFCPLKRTFPCVYAPSRNFSWKTSLR